MGRAPTRKTFAEVLPRTIGALQALNQLAPLTAAKEHLPGDIIDILEHLGKADNIPLISYTALQRIAQTDITQRLYRHLHIL